MSDFIDNFVNLDREKYIKDKQYKLTRREWLVKAPAALATVSMMPLIAQNVATGRCRWVLPRTWVGVI